MVTITTKYSEGDVVYHAGWTTERKQHPCPDCKGSRIWTATSPAGEQYEFACPRCAASYCSFDDIGLDYTTYTPVVARRTIGSVRFSDRGAEYMCYETGVGSGTIYREADLFDTEAEASAAAEARCALQNRETKWIAKLYDKTLQISDYQLGSALIRQGKDDQSRAREMLWNLSDLFASIEDADDKDAILELIADYEQREWDADKSKAA